MIVNVMTQTARRVALAGILLAAVTVAPASFAQVARPEDQLITLESDNTPVVTILEILGERTGLNIVTSPEVQGRSISIRLRNTPFAEALNLVVRAAGLGYERVGNSILVAEPERLATQTGLTTRVFTLQYANATEVAAALDIFSEEVRPFASGNRIIVKAPQSVIEEVAVIIAEVDRRPAQVLFEARLLEVNTSALKELGIDWEKITKWTEIVTEGNPGSTATDQLPKDLGFNELDDFKTIHRQSEAVEVALDLLLRDGNARLLANSKITTLDNQPAEIFIGQTVPVVISTAEQAGGGGLFGSVRLDYIDVGVKLNILPRISGEGFITSTVTPEVSTIVGFVGPNGDLPQTSTRRATAVVRVQDGQKFYLGGLLNEENKETVSKVPILGDIPIVQYLFRHYRIESNQTDLLIEITPVLVRDQG
jgi:type II secretory pathway component GspD/PulD (secretin)